MATCRNTQREVDLTAGPMPGTVQCDECGEVMLERDLTPVGTTFNSPFDQYRTRNGQSFTLMRVVDEPDDQHDEENLPMAVIRFGDGVEIEAWPEEIAKANARNPDLNVTIGD